MGALWQGLAVQRRVILALMLRETHTIYGDARLGYLWVLIQSAFGIAVFWGVREFINAGDPHGMAVAVYLIVGFGIWLAISGTINKCMTAVTANRTLLTFPQVTELDVMVSRSLVTYFTQLVVVLLLLFVAAAMGYEVGVDDPGLLFSCMGLIMCFSLGCGLVFASLAVFMPALERIVPMILRLLMFISGVFFSISAFSSDIAEVLAYNPILQLIELTRKSLSFSYPDEGYSLIYLSELTLTLLSLGLLLERYVRTRRER